MDYLNQYKNYLITQKTGVSAITVKNYLADIRKFISWYEERFNAAFDPAKLSTQIINLFLKSFEGVSKDINSDQKTSAIDSPIHFSASVKRYKSSLRGFFSYLVKRDEIRENPIQKEEVQERKDENSLAQFRTYLTESGMAKRSKKYYLLDVASFLDWASRVVEEINGKETVSVLPYITEPLIHEYKERLLYEKKLSPLSINRNLSSLRRFLSWAKPLKKLPRYEATEAVSNIEKKKEVSKEKIDLPIEVLGVASVEGQEIGEKEDNQPIGEKVDKSGSEDIKYGVWRTAKRIANLSGKILDLSFLPLFLKASEFHEYLAWILHDKGLFDQKPVEIFAKELHEKIADKKTNPFPFLPSVKKSPDRFYLPLSAKHKKFSEQVLYVLRHKRPLWYKKYHSYAFAHYVHFAILMLAISIMGYIFMENVGVGYANRNVAFEKASSSGSRILSYAGTLTNADGTPITDQKKMRFTIYSDQNASGSALLWQEVQNVIPQSDGGFTISLGSGEQIPSDVFNNNHPLYLGLTIEDTNELRPRQQIANVGLSEDSQSVQGLLPITEPGADQKNVLLALDSAGNLSIDGNANPVFQATGGVFTLSGQAVLLTTSPGSGGNVIINPDSFGKIDLQKPIQNTSNSNNDTGILGSVAVEDTLAILATSSAQSALYINQNSTGPIISASSSGTARFSLNADGTAFFSGKIGVGNVLPNASLDVTGGTITADRLGLGTLPDAAYALTTPNNVRASSFVGDQIRTTITNDNKLVKLLVNSPATQSADLAQFQVNGNTLVNISASGNLGIGDSNPQYKISVNGTARVAGDLLLASGSHTLRAESGSNLIIGDGDTGNVLLKPSKNIGIGTDNPVAKVQIAGGGLCVGSDIDCSTNTNTEGVIYATNTTVQNADVAEDYPTTDQSLTPGDIVVLDPNTAVFVHKSNGIPGETPLGVVSTKPGVRLGGFNSEEFKNDKQVPVGLSGRIPVHVDSEGGTIHIGDPLTLSSIPGAAKKASGSGQIIGIALEDFSSADPKNIGSIIFFINKSWFDTNTYITDAGNLHGAPQGVSSNSSFINGALHILDSFGQKADLVAKTVVADSLQVGTIAVSDITINSIRLSDYINQVVSQLPSLQTNKIVSPIAMLGEVHTNIISPLATDGNISLSFGKNTLSIRNGTNASASAVTTFDNNGNATFSGTLTAKDASLSGNLSAGQINSTDASFSGTLHAKKIIADEIDGLPTASPSAQYITNITNVYQTASASATENASPAAGLIAENLGANVMDIASLAGLLNYIPSLQTDYQTVTKGLMAFGPTSLSDTAIAGQLSVNGNFIISDNSINVLGADLSLQPLGQGGVSLVGGRVAIDTDGNLKVNGQAYFTKDVQISGLLRTHIISPVPDSDLVIKLDGSDKSNPKSNFIIQNASGSGVLTINNSGDLHASGSGTFTSLLSKSFQVVRSAQADTSITETVASASAGIAVIEPGQIERTIITPYVKTDSLIYITAVSDTGGITPYLSRQTEQDATTGTISSFTIGIPSVSMRQIKLNWWIVN